MAKGRWHLQKNELGDAAARKALLGTSSGDAEDTTYLDLQDAELCEVPEPLYIVKHFRNTKQLRIGMTGEGYCIPSR
jgi:hypothetical protein